MMNQWMDNQGHAAVKMEDILFETMKNHDA
jgi:hypothetical protein